jgi:hypothetical protein
MTRHGPPGWAPHQAMMRIDGWFVIDPKNENRIPAYVAEIIARAMPPLGGGDTVGDIKARMQARHQLIVERKASLRK